MTIIAAFIAVSLLLLLLTVGGRVDASSFLRRRDAIDDAADLEAFKSLARRNMFAALAYIGLGLAFLGLGITLLVTQGWLGTALMVGFSLVHYFLSKGSRDIEVRTRSLPCPDPALAQEYARVSQSWLKKALPDF
jgi:Mn2+/Fe2+ NRAMP family transporter